VRAAFITLMVFISATLGFLARDHQDILSARFFLLSLIFGSVLVLPMLVEAIFKTLVKDFKISNFSGYAFFVGLLLFALGVGHAVQWGSKANAVEESVNVTREGASSCPTKFRSGELLVEQCFASGATLLTVSRNGRNLETKKFGEGIVVSAIRVFKWGEQMVLVTQNSDGEAAAGLSFFKVSDHLKKLGDVNLEKGPDCSQEKHLLNLMDAKAFSKYMDFIPQCRLINVVDGKSMNIEKAVFRVEGDKITIRSARL
jgi:hypothetical protein